MSDARTNKEVDEHFTATLLEDVRAALAAELVATGTFQPVNLPPPSPGPAPTAPAPAKAGERSRSAPAPARPARAPTAAAASSSEKVTAELRLQPELRRLEWEVPGYGAILGKTFAVSVLTGGLGGGIYVSTPTTVNGYAEVHLELTVTEGGRVVLAREYGGFYTERMAKGSCDTRKTRTRMVTEAFKDAMEKFRADAASAK